MQCIDEGTVESVWQTVSGLDIEQASDEMMKFAQSQPDLLGFATAFSEELRVEAQEIVTYLLFVVYRMFEAAAEKPIPQIDMDDIVAKYEDNQSLMLGLESKDEKVFAEMADLETAHQPHIFGYITEALLEEENDDDDDDEEVQLTDEEFGEIFMLLKTVIDVVDATTN
jgi:hypothetical protein